jgi:hypothetical protein
MTATELWLQTVSHASRSTHAATHSRTLRRPPGSNANSSLTAPRRDARVRRSSGTAHSSASAPATSRTADTTIAVRHPAATATAVTTTGATRLPMMRVEDCTMPRSRPRRRAGAAAKTSAVVAGAPLAAAKPPIPRSAMNNTQLPAAAESNPNTAVTAALAMILSRSPNRPDVALTSGIAAAHPSPMSSARVPSYAEGAPRSAAMSATRYRGANRSKKMAP